MSTPDQPAGPRRRPTAADFDPEVLRLFDQYVHGAIDRRGFLDRVAGVVSGGAAAAAALLATLSPNFALGQKVAPGDARLKIETLEFASPRGYGKARAYVARPAQSDKTLGVVLVVHENRGLNPHIEDVARRLALERYIAVAPDALYTLGGYPGDEDAARALFAKLDPDKIGEDFVAAAAQARALPGANGKLGAVGFCFGGGIVNLLATRVAELAAGVPFYGLAPPIDQVPRIRSELLLMFADQDERINATWPAYEVALKHAGVRYQAFKYPGTQHGFNNDTTPRYDEAAATQAWGRTLVLFDRTLRS
jgi:carboxymethylenebutenolidase